MSVARTESELSDEWEYLIWDTDDTHFFYGFTTEVGDEFVRFLLIFLDDFLDTSWLDTLIFDEVFERFFRDISSKEIEAREKYGIRSIIDDE